MSRRQQKADAEGSAMEVAAEADQMLSADQFHETPTAAPAAAAMAYVEPAPDAMSNALGVMLFIPFIAVIYTIMAAIAAIEQRYAGYREDVEGFHLVYRYRYGCRVDSDSHSGYGNGRRKETQGAETAKAAKSQKGKAA